MVHTNVILLLQPMYSDASEDGSEERIEELQEFVNLTAKDAGNGTSPLPPQADRLNALLFAKDFCFVQTADGQIADVIYPHGENIQVANVKKSIASAFQANFRREDTREETDVSGAHRASYRCLVYKSLHGLTLMH